MLLGSQRLDAFPLLAYSPPVEERLTSEFVIPVTHRQLCALLPALRIPVEMLQRPPQLFLGGNPADDVTTCIPNVLAHLLESKLQRSSRILRLVEQGVEVALDGPPDFIEDAHDTDHATGALGQASQQLTEVPWATQTPLLCAIDDVDGAAESRG